MGAQNTAAPVPALDFSNDACGSPLIESQLWYSVDGKIVGVRDGSTIHLYVANGHHRVTVHLVGVAVEQNGVLAEEAKKRISSLVLNKTVGVLVNTNWLNQKKKPAEVTGVVQLKGDAATDVGLSLLRAGLARTEEPRPYTMSHYAFCKYREAERKAKSENRQPSTASSDPWFNVAHEASSCCACDVGEWHYRSGCIPTEGRDSHIERGKIHKP